jgi:hypothetical protein
MQIIREMLQAAALKFYSHNYALNGSQCWILTIEQMRRKKTEDVHFFREVQGCIMSVVTEELGTGDINTIIKDMRIRA